jgi:LysR family transcriptional regulator, low CO2-responsive transcriptional regulator
VKLDPRISLQKLAVLSLVVELGSVSRAAEQLMVSQPVVSAHLRSLERALGCSLFERRGGRRVLTEAGAAVHRWALQTLRSTRELERRIAATSGGDPGFIVLGASMSLGTYRVSRVLAGFLLERPGLVAREHAADNRGIVEASAAGTIDFGVVLGDPGAENGEIDAEHIGDEPLVLLAAPQTLQGRTAIAVDELRTASLVAVHEGHGADDVVGRALDAVRVQPRLTMELGHPEAVKRVLRESTAVAFLPLSTATAEIERGELRVVDVEGMSLAVPVYVVSRAGRGLFGIEREFVEQLRAAYREDSASRQKIAPPPSTRKSAPVIHEDSSEARKSAT